MNATEPVPWTLVIWWAVVTFVATVLWGTLAFGIIGSLTLAKIAYDIGYIAGQESE